MRGEVFMKVGMIGTGNIGRILIEAMVDGNAISPEHVFITNRTTEKAYRIKQQYPSIHVHHSNEDIFRDADLIFICVKPLEYLDILEKYKTFLSPSKCLVSVTSPISVELLQAKASCSCVRIIPSITNRALAGVSLFTYSKSCKEEWRNKLHDFFSCFSIPYEIKEDITRVSSDIVSCGPAFFSYLTQRFIDGAVAETKIDQETATDLASAMLIGLGELLKKQHYTLPTLQEKVCVKGGITGKGIDVLEENLGDVFQQLFRATEEKFQEDVRMIAKQFSAHL